MERVEPKKEDKEFQKDKFIPRSRLSNESTTT